MNPNLTLVMFVPEKTERAGAAGMPSMLSIQLRGVSGATADEAGPNDAFFVPGTTPTGGPLPLTQPTFTLPNVTTEVAALFTAGKKYSVVITEVAE